MTPERTDLSHLPYAKFVGWSPAGAEWVSYDPETTERLATKLKEVWAKRLEKKPKRFDHCVTQVSLTSAQSDLVWDELTRIEGEYKYAEIAVRVGASYVRGPSWALTLLAEGIESRLDDDHESFIAGSSNRDLTDAQLAFGVKAAETCIRNTAAKLRRL